MATVVITTPIPQPGSMSYSIYNAQVIPVTLCSGIQSAQAHSFTESYWKYLL